MENSRKKNFCIIMEMFSKNLQDFVYPIPPETGHTVTPEVTFKILKDVATGIVFLQSQDLIHRYVNSRFQ